MRPRVPDHVFVEYFDGDGVVFDSRTRLTHYLNPTAMIVYRLCDGTVTTQEIVSDIADAYELPVHTVDMQVRGVVRELRKRGILTSTSARRWQPERNETDQRQVIRQDVPRST